MQPTDRSKRVSESNVLKLNSVYYVDKSLNSVADNFCCGSMNVSFPSNELGDSISKGASVDIKSTTSCISNVENQVNPFGYYVVGYVKETLTCVYQEKHGILYITERALCFRRTGLFGLEIERIVIPLDTIQQVRKHEQEQEQEQKQKQKQKKVIIDIRPGNSHQRNESYQFSNIKCVNNVASQIEQACRDARTFPRPLEKSVVSKLFKSITTLTITDDDTISVTEEDVSSIEDNANDVEVLEIAEDDSAIHRWGELMKTLDQEKMANEIVMVS